MSRNKFRPSPAAPVAGCLGATAVILINVAWVAFVVWAVYTLVSWVVTK